MTWYHVRDCHKLEIRVVISLRWCSTHKNSKWDRKGSFYCDNSVVRNIWEAQMFPNYEMKFNFIRALDSDNSPCLSCYSKNTCCLGTLPRRFPSEQTSLKRVFTFTGSVNPHQTVKVLMKFILLLRFLQLLMFFLLFGSTHDELYADIFQLQAFR